MDECYRVIKVVITNQQKKLNYSLKKELNDIYHMAVNHYEEHSFPGIKRRQELTMKTPSQRISSFPTSNSPKGPSELKPEDRRLIDTLQKENSELKLKV